MNDQEEGAVRNEMKCQSTQETPTNKQTTHNTQANTQSKPKRTYREEKALQVCVSFQSMTTSNDQGSAKFVDHKPRDGKTKELRGRD